MKSEEEIMKCGEYGCANEGTENCAACGKWICPEHTEWRGEDGIPLCQDCAEEQDVRDLKEYEDSFLVNE